MKSLVVRCNVDVSEQSSHNKLCSKYFKKLFLANDTRLIAEGKEKACHKRFVFSVNLVTQANRHNHYPRSLK